MTEAEPYLIAHLVRGSPAFDIAIKLQIGNEEGWIIPTSGHRAYPYWNMKLNDIAERFDPLVGFYVPTAPEGWPDHYTTHAAPGTGLLTNLAERLGLLGPKPTIRRR